MGRNYQSKSMTSEAMRNGNKQHFENLIFSKRALRAKGQVSGHPGHPYIRPCLAI